MPAINKQSFHAGLRPLLMSVLASIVSNPNNTSLLYGPSRVEAARLVGQTRIPGHQKRVDTMRAHEPSPPRALAVISYPPLRPDNSSPTNLMKDPFFPDAFLSPGSNHPD